MRLQFDTRESAGALLIAAGLLLGGAVTLATRHFGLSTPDLLFESPPRSVLEGAAHQSGGAPDSDENGTEDSAGPSITSGEGGSPVGRKARLSPVDVNSAGVLELQAIDGVGPALAGIQDPRGAGPVGCGTVDLRVAVKATEPKPGLGHPLELGDIGVAKRPDQRPRAPGRYHRQVMLQIEIALH